MTPISNTAEIKGIKLNVLFNCRLEVMVFGEDDSLESTMFVQLLTVANSTGVAFLFPSTTVVKMCKNSSWIRPFVQIYTKCEWGLIWFKTHPVFRFCENLFSSFHVILLTNQPINGHTWKHNLLSGANNVTVVLSLIFIINNEDEVNYTFNSLKIYCLILFQHRNRSLNFSLVSMVIIYMTIRDNMLLKQPVWRM